MCFVNNINLIGILAMTSQNKIVNFLTDVNFSIYLSIAACGLNGETSGAHKTPLNNYLTAERQVITDEPIKAITIMNQVDKASPSIRPCSLRVDNISNSVAYNTA